MPRIDLPPPYKVEIVADSLGPSGCRLTTFVVTYPRFVHSELLTHRALSRNSSSSRAIPAAKMRALVRNTPALPVWWGKNQSGMQAREELSDLLVPEDVDDPRSDRAQAQALWLAGRDQALELHERLEKLGLHKQICNRILEPWMPITVIVSATEWENFFNLRDHKDAQPELQVIATEMLYQYREHDPEQIKAGEWHRPYMDRESKKEVFDRYSHRPYEDELNMVSAARCGRVSYLTHDGKRDTDADLKLYERLVTRDDPTEPKHSSPLEHVAQAQRDAYRSGNFRGWMQLRERVEAEQ